MTSLLYGAYASAAESASVLRAGCGVAYPLHARGQRVQPLTAGAMLVCLCVRLSSRTSWLLVPMGRCA